MSSHLPDPGPSSPSRPHFDYSIARSTSLKDRNSADKRKQIPERTKKRRTSLTNLLLPSPSLSKVALPPSLEVQLVRKGCEGVPRPAGKKQKSLRNRAQEKSLPSLCGVERNGNSQSARHSRSHGRNTRIETDDSLFQRLTSFVVRGRERQNRRRSSSLPSRPSFAEEDPSSAARIYQEPNARRKRGPTTQRHSSKDLRIDIRGPTTRLSSPPLPSPCAGLFESSSRPTRPTLTLTCTSHTHSSTGSTHRQLLALPFNPESQDPDVQGLPVPLPLSPLLSPLAGHSNTDTSPCDHPLPPSPITSLCHSQYSQVPASNINPTTPPCYESHSSYVPPFHSRSGSDSSSPSLTTVSTYSHPHTPLDIESVISLTGCKLKSSINPKMWGAASSETFGSDIPIIVESPVENTAEVGIRIRGALRPNSQAEERMQRPSSPALIAVDEECSEDDEEVGEWVVAEASSSGSHVSSDAELKSRLDNSEALVKWSGGEISRRRSFVNRVKRSMTGLRSLSSKTSRPS
ncbi:hypothetical protein V5O48_013957 [Marasmius crinis-equi]|uniref:Uncharacterized protein n=1 Tax=Marasmius crinis-equi TaxID=585013 RepID=A0ABR3EZ10_9AGAR